MSRLISCTSIPITPELVGRVRTAQQLPGERSLKPAHVARLKSAFRECPRAFDWCFAEVNGVGIFRINGQHSSAAVAELADEGFPIQQFVAIETRYECESLDDATRLWSTIDSSMSNRTAAEVIQSLTEGEPAVSGLNIRYRKLLSNGLALASGGIKGMRQHSSFKGSAFVRALRAPVLGKFLAEQIPPLMMRPPGGLASAGAVAAILRTGLDFSDRENSGWTAAWRISQERWSQYWMGLSTGIGLEAGDPRLHMRNWLVTGGRAPHPEQELEILATLVTNWNHWFDAHSILQVKRISSCPTPK